MYVIWMIFATPEEFLYYRDLVKTQRRDYFLAAMFLPEDIFAAAIAIYAFDIELEHVRHVAKEEMMGHIRYSWWYEEVEKLACGKAAYTQPVLQALTKVIEKKLLSPELLLSIVAAYRENYPELPANIKTVLCDALNKCAGGSRKIKKWEKATKIIEAHRSKYGNKRENRLLIKLLFV